MTKIVEHLVAGNKLIPLYEYPTAGISATVAVNAGVQHPIKKSNPTL